MATHVKVGTTVIVGAHVTVWDAAVGEFAIWTDDGGDLCRFVNQSEEFTKELDAALLDVTSQKRDGYGFGTSSSVIEIKSFDLAKDVYDDA